ncbi:hypothetical protein [Neolewinella agarilytica]|uniref:hypothetical protein n=1 Tax=Neolewinella agarilytica TaxID=478744 RepID=UPI00235438DE|nr:hypothetical protein [Neolewinella agarilytica]
MNWLVVCVFLVLSLTIPCFAQTCMVEGMAHLGGSRDGRVTVQALDSTKVRLLGFKVSDERGQYRFDQVPAGKFAIRLSQLGYQDTVYELNCAEGGALTLGPDTLVPLSVDLDEISVIDRAVILQRRGDTTQIDYERLERGHEQSVTDILESVPGLELQANRYKFEGKSIDLVLIDNLNLSGEDQKKLTDGIFYDYIDGIQIVENYTPLGRINPDSSNTQRVLSISLRKESQNTGQLSLRAIGGYNRVYHLGGSYLNVGPGRGWRVEVAGLQNDQEIRKGDDGGLEDLVREGLFSRQYVWLRPFESNFSRKQPIPEGQSTRQQQFQLYYEAKPASGDRRLNAHIKFEHTDGVTEQEGVRNYFQQGTQLNVRGVGMPGKVAINAKMDFAATLGKYGELEVRLPLNTDRQRLSQTESLLLTGSQFNNRQQESNNHINLRPFYQLKWNYSSGWWLSVFGRGSVDRFDKAQTIQSNDSIALPSEFLAGQSQFLSLQQSEYQGASMENHLRLSRKFGELLVEADAASLVYQDDLEVVTAAADQRPFSGQSRWSLAANSLWLRARMDHQKIRYSLRANVQTYQTATAQQKASGFRIDPGFFFLYKLSRSLHVSTSYQVGIQLPNLEQTNTLALQQSQVELSSGGITSIRPTLKKTLALSFFKPITASLGGGALFNLKFAYSPAYQAPRPVTRQFDRFQVTTFSYAEINNECVGDLFFYKNNRASSFQLKLFINSSSFQLDDTALSDRFISLSGGVTFKDIGSFLMDIRTEAFYQNRKVVDGFSNESITIVPQIGVRYVRPGSVLAIYNNLRYNDYGTETNTYFQFDVKYTRKKVFRNVELVLQAVDLFNLNADTRAYSTISQNYFETRTVRVLPGRLLLGLKWYVHR